VEKRLSQTRSYYFSMLRLRNSIRPQKSKKNDGKKRGQILGMLSFQKIGNRSKIYCFIVYSLKLLILE
jgi:hypothetical protein